MLNRVVLVGRLVADPEVKYTPAGVAVASMRVAVNRTVKKDQGEYEADCFNVTAWRRTAEFAQNYLGKGRLISIDGRLQTRSWTAQDGTRRNTVEIVADNIEGLDRRHEAEASATGDSDGEIETISTPPPARKPVPAPARPPAKSTASIEDDDDDPFADE